MQDAADSLARLDDAVASTTGAATLLMLRSAEAIAATHNGPSGPATDRESALAALIGWWFAVDSREFIVADPMPGRAALALDVTATRVREGRALTVALLHEAVGVREYAECPVSHGFELTLRRADSESWPALLLAAELLAGECGRVPGLPAAIARAVAPLVGELGAGVFVPPSPAEDVPAALHRLATSARDVRRRVHSYRVERASAVECASGFGRGAASALALLDLLARTPAVTIAHGASSLGLTVPTAGAAVERLSGAGYLREITGRGRDRVFVYEPAIALAG